MNIKELVLVISILLSIRIAEYAMKKYKEQKDVEVTKKQKSRKQTKKYIITAPSILKCVRQVKMLAKGPQKG